MTGFVQMGHIFKVYYMKMQSDFVIEASRSVIVMAKWLYVHKWFANGLFGHRTRKFFLNDDNIKEQEDDQISDGKNVKIYLWNRWE